MCLKNRVTDRPAEAEGFTYLFSADDKVAARIRMGWEFADYTPYAAGPDTCAYLLHMPTDMHDNLQYRNQLRKDLISAERGVDDGKDLHEYARKWSERQFNTRMQRWSLWRLAKSKWRRQSGAWWYKLWRMVRGVDEDTVYPGL